jgi:hypothetical protein
MNRRRFLRRAIGRTAVDLSCERLYVQFVDASLSGRLPEFLQRLEREVAAAGEICLTHREWLSRDDFRRAVGPCLGVR